MAKRPNNTWQELFSFSFEHPGVATVAATGTITCGTDAAATDGNSVTIGDGINAAVTFEYDKSANGVAGSNTTWAAGTTAASNATALRLLILAAFPALSVADDLAGVLTLTHRWPGTGGNITITKSGTGAVSAVTGMSGGIDASSHNATYTKKLMTTQRAMRVDKVEYINPTGLAGHATQYWEVALKGGATVMAQWSTDSDVVGEGTLTANAVNNLTLSATDASTVAAAGVVLSLALTKVSTAANLPAGRIVVHGRYVS